ncbi:MAG: ADP-glyceromanno-heptose 6-epimerase [Gemmatimonadales bacterium]|nr:ADP-glyceromanno-heptose 6-epimerase [Gemmatimonadales bacterium]
MGLFIVTGGAGFIGSTIVRALNDAGTSDIVVVDDLTHGSKHANLADCRITDLLDRREFLDRVERCAFDATVEAVLHQGACTDTMERDEGLMMEHNFRSSEVLLRWVVPAGIPFVYASSAAVYGGSTAFAEEERNERPLNIYGQSKLRFDQLVRGALPEARATVVGLRYFNVYGPREAHKGRMASVVFQMARQLRETGEVRLFVGTGGYADGEQRRDFVYVEDIVRVNLFFARGPVRKGVVNCGTGKSRSFNDVARALIAAHGSGTIQYTALPDGLESQYQSFTEADLAGLRRLGYEASWLDVEEGVRRYYGALSGAEPARGAGS